MPEQTLTQCEPIVTAVTQVRRQMLMDFCAAMERHEIPYVILSGYQSFPDRIESDIDFMVSKEHFRRLPAFFTDPSNIPGARLVQVLHHETSACYYVLVIQHGPHLAYLHPDSASDYRRSGRLWLRSSTVLQSRRKSPTGFWIPAPAVEFEYYFVKRVDKRSIEPRHIERLAALHDEDPQGCERVLARLVDDTSAKNVLQALRQRDATGLALQSHALHAALRGAHAPESVIAQLQNWIAELRRRTRRVLRPAGLVVAVMGPDGSGKTTVIEHLVREFEPAFRRTLRFHLRPRFGGPMGEAVNVAPHAQPPRSHLASLAKLGYFFVDYWLGWLRQVWPAKTRSTLVVFDRYFHDMLVDQRRYRLPPGFPFGKWLAPLVPQPDLWILLTAQPEILHARKGEVSLADAHKLNDGYVTLARNLPNSALIDTTASLEDTLTQVVTTVRETLEARARKSLGTAR